MFKISAVSGVIFSMMACAIQSAQADQLQDVKEKGVLVCGTFGTVQPFSFTNPTTREVEGYEVDVCKAIATDLGVKLEIKLVAAASRIAELQQGRVDVIAATLAWTPERAEQIDFSDQYFVTGSKLGVRSADGYTAIAELAEKRISATKGGLSEASVHKLLPNAKVLAYQDPPAAFLALQQGKVDAVCLDELMLVSFQKQVEKKQPITILEPPTVLQHWGIGLRKGEKAFREQVNATLNRLEASGEASKLFDKWMGPATTYQLQRNFKVIPLNG